MPNRKVPTTWKCRWRPNRKRARQFTVADASRVCCNVVQGNRGTFAAIESHFRRTCGKAPARRTQNAAEQALELAATTTANNSAVLNEAYNLFILVNQLVDAALLVISLLPVGRVFRALAVVTRRITGVRAGGQNLVAQTLDRIIVQQAANDRAFVQFQIAANEARFLRRASGE